jgi:Mg-chelatase subunit ChlD
MPADRVTSYSPWHVVLILDDSISMEGDPIENINTAVRAMIDEMLLISGGMKPYFKITIIKFGDSAELVCEAASEKDVDIDMVSSLKGDSGVTNVTAALRLACEVLERHPGESNHFEPFVLFFSDGVPYDGTSEQRSRQGAIQAGERLKGLTLSSGAPRLLTIGFGTVDDTFMAELASNRLGSPGYKKLDGSRDILRFLPDIGTLAVSQSADQNRSAADAVEEGIIDL